MLFITGMLMRRCAWHRQYNGYPMVYGVAAWRQRGLQYTDGMCRRCAVTATREWTNSSHVAPRPRPAVSPRLAPAGRVGIALAAASLLVALALMASLRNGGGDVPVSAFPRAATDSKGGLEGPPSPHRSEAPRQDRGAPRSP